MARYKKWPALRRKVLQAWKNLGDRQISDQPWGLEVCSNVQGPAPGARLLLTDGKC